MQVWSTKKWAVLWEPTRDASTQGITMEGGHCYSWARKDKDRELEGRAS